MNKLLTTRVLNQHGKIGPFFFKEFIFVFLGTSCLFFLVLLLSIFVQIRGILLLLIPGAFLAIAGSIRLVFSKQVETPWYIHHWIALRGLQPRHIAPDQLLYKKHTLPTRPNKQAVGKKNEAEKSL